MAYEPESSSSPRERRGQYIFGRLDHHSQHHAQPSTRSVTTDSETCTLKTYRNPHQWPVIPLGYQVCLRLLILTLSALVSAALIYLIIIRSSTGDSRHLDREGHNVPAWPATVWMQPTFVLLGAAAFCTLGNFSFLIAECSKFGRRWLGSKAVWIASLCIVCMIAAWIIATAYAKTFGATNTFASDLWSWSCARKDVQLNYGNSRIGFVKLCQYMDFVFGAGVATMSLELMDLVLVWLNEMGHRASKQKSRRNALIRKHITGLEMAGLDTVDR